MKKSFTKTAIALPIAIALSGAALAAGANNGYGHGGGEYAGKSKHCQQGEFRAHGKSAQKGRGYSGNGHGAGGTMALAPGEFIDGKIAFIKAELEITAEQEAEWNAFADVLRQGMEKRTEMAGMRDEMRKNHAMKDMEAADMMAMRISHMEERLEHMKAMQAAMENLSGVLTPEQKESAKTLKALGRNRGHM